MDQGISPSLAEVYDVAALAARAAAAKKALDPVVLEVGGVLAITDAFVITSGTNVRQVRTIAEEVEAQLGRATGRKPLRTEGLDTASWVLLDYGDFVVHVFLDEVRRYYDLERLWADAPRVPWEGEGADSRSAVSR
jgi:ribosome-associated protein